MPVQEKPYFLENKEWYTFNEEEWKYELTDKAPQEAIDSYNEFYNDETRIDNDGNISIVNPDIDDNDEDEDEQSDAMSLFGLQGGQNNGMQ